MTDFIGMGKQPLKPVGRKVEKKDDKWVNTYLGSKIGDAVWFVGIPSLNSESKNGKRFWDSDKFELQFSSATIIEKEGYLWLLASLLPEAEGAYFMFEGEDKAVVEEAKKLWVDNGCLAAIPINNITSLTELYKLWNSDESKPESEQLFSSYDNLDLKKSIIIPTESKTLSELELEEYFKLYYQDLGKALKDKQRGKLLHDNGYQFFFLSGEDTSWFQDYSSKYDELLVPNDYISLFNPTKELLEEVTKNLKPSESKGGYSKGGGGQTLAGKISDALTALGQPDLLSLVKAARTNADLSDALQVAVALSGGHFCPHLYAGISPRVEAILGQEPKTWLTDTPIIKQVEDTTTIPDYVYRDEVVTLLTDLANKNKKLLPFSWSVPKMNTLVSKQSDLWCENMTTLLLYFSPLKEEYKEAIDEIAKDNGGTQPFVIIYSDNQLAIIIEKLKIKYPDWLSHV